MWGEDLDACSAALLAPVFKSGLSITVLSQMGIAIIACLSYNMLLGRHAEFRSRGVRGWGHTIHALNAVQTVAHSSPPYRWWVVLPAWVLPSCSAT